MLLHKSFISKTYRKLLMAVLTATAGVGALATPAGSTVTPLNVVVGGYPGTQYQPDAHFSTGSVAGVVTQSTAGLTKQQSYPFTFVASCLSTSSCATGATVYWSFGDGTTQTTTSPTIEHVYSKTGVYKVTATVAAAGSSGTSYITALASPRYADVAPDTATTPAPASRQALWSLAASGHATPCRVALNIAGINPTVSSTSTAEGRAALCPTPLTTYGPPSAPQNTTPEQLFENAANLLSPAAMWPLNETSGTVARDAVAGSPSFPGTYSSTGVSLAGVGPLTSSLAPTLSNSGTVSTTYVEPQGSYTEALWFKSTATATNIRLLSGTLSNPSSSLSITLNDPNSSMPGSITASVLSNSSTGAADVGVSSNQPFNDGNWHFVVATITPGTQGSVAPSQIALYVDGQLVPTTSTVSGSVPYPLVSASPGLSIAPPTTTGCVVTCSPFYGSISNVVVYNTSLTYGAVASIYLAARDYLNIVNSQTQVYQNSETSLKAYTIWPLYNNTSTTNVKDVSGNGYSGTYSPTTPVNTSGALSNTTSPVFTGANSILSSVKSPNSTAYSLSALFKTSSTGSNETIISDAGTTYPQESLSVVMGGYGTYAPATPGVLDFLLTGGTSSASPVVIGVQTTGTYNDNTWHQVTATWSAASGSAVAASQFSIYIDGNLVTTKAIQAPVGAATSPLSPNTLGAGSGFSGNLNQLASYNYALSATQILSQYDTLVTNAPNIRLYNNTQNNVANYWPMSGANSFTAYSSLAQQVPSTYSSYANNETVAQGTGQINTLIRGPYNGQSSASGFTGSNYETTTVAATEPANDLLSGWFKTTGSGVIESFTNSQFSTTPSTSDQTLWLDSNGKLNFNVGSSQLTTTASYNDGTWHRFLIAVSPTGTQLVVDNSTAATSSSAISTSKITGFWRFGQGVTSGLTNSVPSGYFTGDLADMTQYSNLTYPITLASYNTTSVFGNSLALENNAAVFESNQSPTDLWPLSSSQPTYNETNLQNYVSATPAAFNNSGPFESGFNGALSAEKSIPVVSSLEETLASSFTEAAWFKTSASAPILSFNNSPGSSAPTTYKDQIWIDAKGHVVFNISSSADTSITSSGNYANNVWHYVAAVYSPNFMAIYIDGSLAASTTSPASLASYGGYFHIGSGYFSGVADAPTSNVLSGRVADVSYYSTLRSQSQVAALYQQNTPTNLLTTTPMPSSTLNGVTGISCLATPAACGLPASAFALSASGNPVAGCSTACIAKLQAEGYLLPNGNLEFNATNCTYGYGASLNLGNWVVNPGYIAPGCETRGQFFATLVSLLDSGKTTTTQSSTLTCTDATPQMKRAFQLGINPEYLNSSYCFPSLGISKEAAYAALSQALNLRAATTCPTTLRDLADETLGHGTPTQDPNCGSIWGLLNTAPILTGTTTCADGVGSCFNGWQGVTVADAANLFSSLLGYQASTAAGLTPDVFAQAYGVSPGTPVTVNFSFQAPAYYQPGETFAVSWSPIATGDASTCPSIVSITTNASNYASATCTYTPGTTETVPLSATVADIMGNVATSTTLINSSSTAPTIVNPGALQATVGTVNTYTISVKNSSGSATTYGIRSTMPDQSSAYISSPNRVFGVGAVTNNGLATISTTSNSSMTFTIAPPASGNFSLAMEACNSSGCSMQLLRGTA